MRLPPQHPLRRKVSRSELKRLERGFAKQKSRETGPDEGGVTKDVGAKMIHAAADDAEERMKQQD